MRRWRFGAALLSCFVLAGVQGRPARPCPTQATEVPAEWHGSELHKAVLDLNWQQVNKLLARGVAPDGRDNRGDTALVLALTPGRRLEPRGIVSKEQREAGIQIENHAQMQMATSLIQYKADVNAAGSMGDTPLMRLAMNGYGTAADLRLAKLLVEHGARVDAQNDYGYTALLMALDSGKIELAKFLLSKGADPEIGNCRGDSPLSVARKRRGGMVGVLEGYRRGK